SGTLGLAGSLNVVCPLRPSKDTSCSAAATLSLVMGRGAASRSDSAWPYMQTASYERMACAPRNVIDGSGPAEVTGAPNAAAYASVKLTGHGWDSTRAAPRGGA